MFNEDRRMFPEFEDQGDYVQLKTNEYPAGNIQNLAQGYEGLFEQDRRMFPEFEDKGDYWTHSPILQKSNDKSTQSII